MSDPIDELVHDHGELNRCVIALGVQLRRQAAVEELVDPLVELREQLFLHFAREEEGLFPFVAEHASDLADQVQGMEIAHDTICGSLARMVHLAETGAAVATIAAIYDRFENAYAAHAQMEAELLATLAERLDADQRSRLAALVGGL